MDCIIKSVDLIFKNEVQIIENNSDEMTYFSFPTKNDVEEFKRKGKVF